MKFLMLPFKQVRCQERLCALIAFAYISSHIYQFFVTLASHLSDQNMTYYKARNATITEVKRVFRLKKKK